MKKFLILLAALFMYSSSSFATDTLYCDATYQGHDFYAAVLEGQKMSCTYGEGDNPPATTINAYKDYVYVPDGKKANWNYIGFDGVCYANQASGSSSSNCPFAAVLCVKCFNYAGKMYCTRHCPKAS